jgi:hypothetical protein
LDILQRESEIEKLVKCSVHLESTITELETKLKGANEENTKVSLELKAKEAQHQADKTALETQIKDQKEASDKIIKSLNETLAERDREILMLSLKSARYLEAIKSYGDAVSEVKKANAEI